jgi:hypothetical protein
MTSGFLESSAREIAQSSLLDGGDASAIAK